MQDFRGGAARASNASVVHDACRGNLACALAVEKIARVDSIQQESIAGVALTIGPDRLITQSGVHASPIRQFGVHPGRKNRETRETARR